MKKILFICNTPYQLLMACNTVIQRAADKIDVIVSDHFSGSKEIVERINSQGLLFRKAYYVPDLSFCRRKGEWQKKRGQKRLLYGINIKKTFENFMTLEDTYDELWIANWEEFANVAWNYMLRYNNSKIELMYYEDGFATWALDWRRFAIELNAKPKYRILLEKYLLNLRYTHNCLFEYHVTHPELLSFDPGCPVIKDEFVLKSNDYMIEKVNEVFGYYNNTDIYDKKVLFFEESYYADGEDINDKEIVDQISNIVGVDNIMIKIHPRSPNNRWAAAGYKTNKNISIPWEVVMLNQDMSNKIMISYMSGATASSFLLFQIGGKTISLSDLYFIDRIYDERNIYDILARSYNTTFREIFPSSFFFPHCREELLAFIEEKIVEI